jgi:A/G-specific adenine glycosylase
VAADDRVPARAAGRTLTLRVRALRTWYRENARSLPWRAPGADAWAVLVSEVMLHQTPVTRVVPVYLEWQRRWPTPAGVAAAEGGALLRVWGRLGYPRRALRLRDCARTVLAEHGGRLPADVALLRRLPGIGLYTAHAVAAFGFGEREPALDTNARRVLARSLAGRADAVGALTVMEVDRARTSLPVNRPAEVAAAVMELGALVCRPRRPRCDACPLRRSCRWLAAGAPADPATRRRPQPYVGTHRQARGVVLARLRAADRALSAAELTGSEPELAERALASLLTDGLVVAAGRGFTLPS